METWLIIYLVAINLIAFIICLLDKIKAVRHKWRIPEKTLFLLAAIGGSVGLFLSMRIFRHKTKHLSFVLGIPAIILVQCCLAWLIFRK
ncbi:MAG: DUF1294 domain-containing protein [Clostridia bacterium]|nr:DUF1294 domain-containing protein [Clostridia bacterium]